MSGGGFGFGREAVRVKVKVSCIMSVLTVPIQLCIFRILR